jgi:hypothetical protein
LIQHTKTRKNILNILILNDHKIYQMTKNAPNGQKNRPNGQKLQEQDPPKFTQIGIFGVKIYHLATPVSGF